MELSQVKVGTRLELEILDEDGLRAAPIMLSKFEGAEDESHAVVAAPIFQGNIYAVSLDAELDVYFVYKRGISSNRFKFRAKVKDRISIGNLQFLKLELLEKISPAQRRNYFRLEYFTEVEYRVVNSLDPQSNVDIPFKRTLTSNLSGGGIGIMLEEKIDLGSLVECIIKTDESKEVRFFGCVKRFEEKDIKGRLKYIIGIAYIKINDDDKEAVIKFIFNEQRKMRRRGLI